MQIYLGKFDLLVDFLSAMSERKVALKPKNSLIDRSNLSTKLEVLHVCLINL